MAKFGGINFGRLAKYHSIEDSIVELVATVAISVIMIISIAKTMENKA